MKKRLCGGHSKMMYQSYYKNKSEYVEKVALELRAHLDNVETKTQINEVHKLHAKSQSIQKIFEPFLVEKGFVSEKKGLFESYRLRPDLFNSELGIIVEVERGRIKSNNMHLLDIWKCHLATQANHLFLIIPIERHRTNDKPEKIFDYVSEVISSFFVEGNYINIDSCYIFGY